MNAVNSDTLGYAERFFHELKEDLALGRLLLPTLPEVAIRVRDEVENDNSTADTVAKIIASDAALSARLVQVVNSPIYRGQDPINEIRMAVARLGMTVVRSLVTGIVMQQIFQATSDALDTRLRDLWQHSTTVAAISNVLAKQYTRLKPDEALLAGLIHDIGVLPVLVKAENFPELIEQPALLDMVIRAYHTELGVTILESWEFAPEFVTVVREHDDLERKNDGPADLTDVVQAANLQAYLGTDHEHAQVQWEQVGSFARLGIATDTEEVEMAEDIEEIVMALGG
jgi:putative nucleotidyltransferase with HDIG domain